MQVKSSPKTLKGPHGQWQRYNGERLEVAFVEEKAADIARSNGFIKCIFLCALIFESCMHQYRNLYCFIHVVLVHAPNVSKNIFIISMCVAACTSIFFLLRICLNQKLE